MVIGTFPELFGTAHGTALQRWCTERGWVLVWALGPNVPGGGSIPNAGISGPPVAVDARSTRALDPTVFVHSSASRNSSMSAATSQSFLRIWGEMSGRDAAKTPPAQYELWFGKLPPALAVRGLLAGDCADPSSCIGTRQGGHCVCYQ